MPTRNMKWSTRESAFKKYNIQLETIFNKLKEAEDACNNGNYELVGTSL